MRAGLFFALRPIILGSLNLSNHGDEGHKKVTNLHIQQRKGSNFARFARAFFVFVHFVAALVLPGTLKELLSVAVIRMTINFQIIPI